MSEVIEQIKGVADLVAGFQQQHDEALESLRSENAELKGRVEMLEALGDRPKLAGGNEQAKRYHELPMGDGRKGFIVPSDVKLAEIPELQAKEKPAVSLDRWCRALVLGNACEDKEALEYVAEQKSVSTGSTGVLIPEGFVAQWIDMARAQSVLMRAGTRTVPMMEQTLTYSHQTGDPTFSWRSTEGASLSATDPTFASRVLTARTVAVRTQVSLEATQDIPNFGEQISAAYTRAFGAAIDKAGIQGAGGSPALIKGLQQTAGVGTVTNVGTPTNWDEVLDAIAEFLNANNSLEELTGLIWHPNIWKTYAKLKTGISSDNTPLEMPEAVANVPKFATTNADVASSPENYHVELGNFTDYVMGVRMNPSIRILDATTSMASNLLVEIVGVARVDFLAVRPASFVVMSGVIT
ncbi:phage major capsid protein [Thioalkalivibrio sp.]|uniref:phage major capsid protein n=1 Tax=Thioalkalivibrio sp. TaxID=2093813 RepID=UPI00356239DD